MLLRTTHIVRVCATISEIQEFTRGLPLAPSRNEQKYGALPRDVTPSLFLEDTSFILGPKPEKLTSPRTADVGGKPIPSGNLLFGIPATEIQRIREVSRQIDPNADFSRIGSWGILVLCCGATAGQGRRWKSKIASDLNHPITEAYFAALLGKLDADHIAILFSRRIKSWALSGTCGQEADRSVLRIMPDADEKTQSHTRFYLALAILLNSYGLDSGSPSNDEESQIWAWASLTGTGWDELFFAAGLLLSSDQEFRRERLVSVLRALSHIRQGDIQKLLDRYSPMTNSKP